MKWIQQEKMLIRNAMNVFDWAQYLNYTGRYFHFVFTFIQHNTISFSFKLIWFIIYTQMVETA